MSHAMRVQCSSTISKARLRPATHRLAPKLTGGRSSGAGWTDVPGKPCPHALVGLRIVLRLSGRLPPMLPGRGDDCRACCGSRLRLRPTLSLWAMDIGDNRHGRHIGIGRDSRSVPSGSSLGNFGWG